jgi:hypothetical protein
MSGGQIARRNRVGEDIDVDAELERLAIRRVDRKAGREPFSQYADQFEGCGQALFIHVV